MSELVVLVDGQDRPLGSAEKLDVHKTGTLHRAFSVFVFDAIGRLLLQKRAPGKYHSGGRWSNTCCSHPRPGEEPLTSARRRLSEEMGFDCPLQPAFQKHYRLSVGDDLIEHEYDHVFVGTIENADVHPNPTEVADWSWVHPDELGEEVRAHPGRYTPWFRLLLAPTVAAAQEMFDFETPQRPERA